MTEALPMARCAAIPWQRGGLQGGRAGSPDREGVFSRHLLDKPPCEKLDVQDSMLVS